MAFIRQYVAPLVAILLFLVALVVVSVRIFSPSDLAAPAPIEDMSYSSVKSLNSKGSLG